ncbi:MAG: class I SAM-dependent methyltransferase [Nitrospiraceae bacterium]|nr:class I SAM-dependent methyltransferase [Nitrospiraceae bacterium]
MYATVIFPRLMDWALSQEFFLSARQELLAQTAGSVLEIGFGTGLNIPHYPHTVTRVTAVDPVPLLPRRVTNRIGRASVPVSLVYADAEQLPFASEHFDCVVCTFTLCTIPDPISALREVERVLKPEGRFYFLEHGRSDLPSVARWQDRLNPIQNVIGCGCNLNRPIDRLVTQAGLSVEQLSRSLVPDAPRILGELYRGTARRTRT